MRIGVDIDNVISNFDDVLFESYMEYDKTLRDRGIIKKNVNVRKRFDWSKEEAFYKNNLERKGEIK